MSSKHRLTRSFRTLSAVLYSCNIGCAIHFLIRNPIYLNILVGCIVTGISIVMLMITIEAPKSAMDRFERSLIGAHLFTFRGRYMIDLGISLFLFAMPPWGILFGIATLVLIFGIRFLGVKQPDAFNEIFRQSIPMSSAGSTAPSEYENPVLPQQQQQQHIPGQYNNGTNNQLHHNHVDHDAYTLESEYDTPVVERR